MAQDTHQSSLETIEVITHDRRPGQTWTPSIGTEILGFREHLEQLEIPQSDRDTVLNEALSVLSRCVPPANNAGRDTGLIIGYVQSGKTMSFTAVAALARDNGYRLIIIITGVTRNLFHQSTDRLRADLRLDTRPDPRSWQFFDNPRDRSDVRQRIASALESNESLPGIGRQTVLITVMKNGTHLDKLIGLLSTLRLDGIPALVIDDEADQASLNSRVKKGQESATFRRLNELRQSLPHHTFLQYTATPQALLLINVINALSPSFVELLTPGSAYTGGKTFFERDFRLVRSIPGREIPTDENPIQDVPSSLKQAMMLFFLGVAEGLRRGPARENRSMMIHPSKKRILHTNYAHWTREVQRNWKAILSLDTKDPDQTELLHEFHEAYKDLQSTVIDLPSFEEVLPYLKSAVQLSIITVENAAKGPTPAIDWKQVYANILVGGDVLNRGFTVKGLTVTYIPRGSGVGNADTIQQRARWFGYKSDYLGFCRVYLDDPIRNIYESYVRQEESIRQELRKFRDTGLPLREWTRRFFIAPELRPTRGNVLDLEYARGVFSNKWYEPRAPHDSASAIKENRLIVDEFLSRWSFSVEQWHDKATDDQKYLVARTPLNVAYEDLLTKIRVTKPTDLQRFTGLCLQIDRRLQQNPAEECTIYQMSLGEIRKRTAPEDNNGEIPHIHQGPTPARGVFARGEIYPGDAKIKSPAGVSIQIHNLDVFSGQGNSNIARNVPAITVWMPGDDDGAWLAGPGQIR